MSYPMPTNHMPTNGPVAPIPPDVAALATARAMGPYLTTHEPKRFGILRMTALLIFTAGFLILAFVSLGAGAWVGVFICAAIGGVFLTVLIRSPNLNPSRAALRIHVFQNGFIQVTKTGPVDYRWDAIQSVLQSITRRYYNGIYVGTTYLYTVSREDGRITKLTNFYDQIDVLGQIVAREVTRVQLPLAIGAIRAGQTVYFGDLAVNAGGLASAGKGSLSWSEIQKVEIARGIVSVEKQGKWLSWSNKPASSIPNLFVFLALAEQLAGGVR